MSEFLPVAKAQYLDNSGDPLSGGKIHTYIANTTTEKATYTDSSEATPNANPVILDAAGRANIWLGSGFYKIVVKDSDDNTLWTVDNVSRAGQGEQGVSFLVGSVVPASELGVNGDSYLRTDTGQIYLKASGSWAVDTDLNTYWDARLATKDTDDLSEGATNKYYATSLFNTDLATKDTDDLSEGATNLYFTDARADARIAAASIDDLVDVDTSSVAPQDGNTLVWDTDHWEPGAASGGGGGGSLELYTVDSAAQETYLNNFKVFEFEDAISQYIYFSIKVPSSYVAGNQINLVAKFTCEETSGTVLFTALTTLLEDDDTISDTTDQHTSTNTAITQDAAFEVESVTMDLTDGSGEINSTAVAGGDLLLVRITRDTSTDTAANAVYLLKHSLEVSFG